MAADDLQTETVQLLQQLIRLNTVNPPGKERPAIEHLERYLSRAGFATEILAAEPERPNLVATLEGRDDAPTHPVLCLLGHVDTVLADPSEWRHDPWSGDVADGYLWGRGALDMKNQVACEAVAAGDLAREGWRPARGALKLVFVSDEETGGDVGAHWLTDAHPEKVRCDLLLNEGAGEVFEYRGRRRYGVCCAEKGIFRFNVTASGVAGHASLPRTGDNALLKMAPVLAALARQPECFELTEAPAALLRGLGEDPEDPSAALARIEAEDPLLRTLIEPMFGVTLTPTMTSASTKINVIPSRAQVRIDCRVPPGLGEEAVWRRITQVLGEESEHLQVDFTEQVTGNASPVESELMTVIDRWISDHDPGAGAVPVILPGFSDSRWFRDAFPECVAYGFFPQRHQSMLQAAPLVHNADERIDLRDLGFATGFYRDVIGEMLG
ncbi:MAG TPA: M20/M25/M40 family metallo-hydrolase [Solirubrobacteraceae bacterium]|jgi:acetylornithine deacetylase/succinyl-diaminopimelate desuccinylase-like protein|nr:M20/M25/M40 family metallo-hydrolase [Solirubrobacteraceae bacterium]